MSVGAADFRKVCNLLVMSHADERRACVALVAGIIGAARVRAVVVALAELRELDLRLLSADTGMVRWGRSSWVLTCWVGGQLGVLGLCVISGGTCTRCWAAKC